MSLGDLEFSFRKFRVAKRHVERGLVKVDEERERLVEVRNSLPPGSVRVVLTATLDGLALAIGELEAALYGAKEKEADDGTS